MPSKANNPQRPWQSKAVDYNKLQGQGRGYVTGFYQSKEWRMVRLSHITQNPICVECKQAGRPEVGKIVDHIKPINQRDPYDTMGGKYGEALNYDNLQTLCEKHHAIKSGKERWKK